jgi:hypothetical protein
MEGALLWIPDLGVPPRAYHREGEGARGGQAGQMAGKTCLLPHGLQFFLCKLPLQLASHVFGHRNLLGLRIFLPRRIQ